jgi:hypothetical protein
MLPPRSNPIGTILLPRAENRERRIAVKRQTKPTETEAGAESKVKPEETSANVRVNRPRAKSRNDR